MTTTPKLAFACVLFAAINASGNPPADRVPVLMELFTSDSCPDGPEASRLLERLDREQPFEGVSLVVLSEHVDYFNVLGWTDPFSLPLFTARQRDYSQRLSGNIVIPRSVPAETRSRPIDSAANETQVYTPEVIVDGAVGFAGSDMGDAGRAVQEALKIEKFPIRVEVQHRQGREVVSIHMDRSPEGTLYLALAHDIVRSYVRGGPNQGLHLSHVAVVYSLQEIGRINQRGEGYNREITAKVQPDSRVVVFVEKAEDAGVDDAVTLSAKLLHRSVKRAGVGRVTAVGQTKP